MRVEFVHGRYLLCGGILPQNSVKEGQRWAPADGSNKEVVVSAVAGDWVTYHWIENGVPKFHQKLNFAFQCRYCLVVDTPDVPEEFLV